MKFVVVGRLGALHGLQGWLRLHSHTEPRENIFQYSRWYLRIRDERQPVQVAARRKTDKDWLVQLVRRGEPVDDRDTAADLVGAEISVDRAALPPLEEGEYYWADLLGLEVTTVKGCKLGTLSYWLDTGANDVMVVHGERERLIPFLRGDTVKSVNTEGGGIVVDWDPAF